MEKTSEESDDIADMLLTAYDIHVKKSKGTVDIKRVFSAIIHDAGIEGKFDIYSVRN